MATSHLKEEFSEEYLPASEDMVRNTTLAYQLLTYSERTHIHAGLNRYFTVAITDHKADLLALFEKMVTQKKAAYRGTEPPPGWTGLQKHILLI